jgi:predicted Zn-ribbon and HTH transcriptional regulator
MIFCGIAEKRSALKKAQKCPSPESISIEFPRLEIIIKAINPWAR